MKFKADELDTIPDLLYRWLSKPRADFDLQKTTFFKGIQQRFAGCKAKAIRRTVAQSLNTLKQYIGVK